MILTDREIQIAIKSGAIAIEPRPNAVAFSSTSLDLTLNPDITIFKPRDKGVEIILDPSDPGFHPEQSLSNYTEQVTIPADGYPLRPNVLVLAWTAEVVDLRLESRIAARVEGKSSLARIGLGVHITAPTIHAGFRGPVRLEVVNHGSAPIRLRTGMRICQLIFELTLGTPDRGYRGMFYDQEVAGQE